MDLLGFMPDLRFDVPGYIGMEPHLDMNRRPLVHAEARSHEIVQIDILGYHKRLSGLMEHLDPVQGEYPDLVSHVAETDQVIGSEICFKDHDAPDDQPAICYSYEFLNNDSILNIGVDGIKLFTLARD